MRGLAAMLALLAESHLVCRGPCGLPEQDGLAAVQKLSADSHSLCRGHVDSVNEVAWQPYSSSLLTASSDKTVSIWDARSGLCTQTFYGHHNSCSCATFNLTVCCMTGTSHLNRAALLQMAVLVDLPWQPGACNQCSACCMLQVQLSACFLVLKSLTAVHCSFCQLVKCSHHL